MEAPQSSCRWVYFLQAESGGPILIGQTKGEPARRIKTVQANSPFPLVCLGLTYGPETLAAELRQRFASAQIRQDWFAPAAALLDYIRGLEAPVLPPVELPQPAPILMSSQPEILTVAEVAELLRISRMKAYALIREGKIPSLRLGARLVIPRESLAEMIRSGTRLPSGGEGQASRW